jgi:hypothetical protein
MPAERIPPGASHACRRFSIIGTDAENATPFIRHAALLWEDGTRNGGETASAFHMAPPLGESTVSLHVVGWIEDLTDDERYRLETWAADIRTRIALDSSLPPEHQGYIIHPPYIEEPSEDGERTRWRFSCIGLALKCYEEIGIQLVDWHSPQMPIPSEETIRLGYRLPLQFARQRRPQWILSPDPCRVVLPGYVFHSLNRSAANVRTLPVTVQPAGSSEGAGRPWR